MPKDTPKAPSSATDDMPATWAEYFTEIRAACQAFTEASKAFAVASERYTECSDRVDSLASWANRANEVVPYVGQSVSDVPVNLDPGASS